MLDGNLELEWNDNEVFIVKFVVVLRRLMLFRIDNCKVKVHSEGAF
jgi:hypothetical protein